MSSFEPAAGSLVTESDRKPVLPVVVSICTTCRTIAGQDAVPIPAQGPELIEALRMALGAGAADVTVRPVQCLSVCKHPTTAAISAANGFTFIFGDLRLETAPSALASFVDLYRRADYGFVPWRQRPESLRRGIVARLPPAAWSPDDGRPPE